MVARSCCAILACLYLSGSLFPKRKISFLRGKSSYRLAANKECAIDRGCAAALCVLVGERPCCWWGRTHPRGTRPRSPPGTRKRQPVRARLPARLNCLLNCAPQGSPGRQRGSASVGREHWSPGALTPTLGQDSAQSSARGPNPRH